MASNEEIRSVSIVQGRLRARRGELVDKTRQGPAPEGRTPTNRDRLGWRCDKCSYLNGAFKNGDFEVPNTDMKCSHLEKAEWDVVPSIDNSKVECEHIFDPKCCTIVTVPAEEGWVGQVWKEGFVDVAEASGAGEGVVEKEDPDWITL